MNRREALLLGAAALAAPLGALEQDTGSSWYPDGPLPEPLRLRGVSRDGTRSHWFYARRVHEFLRRAGYLHNRYGSVEVQAQRQANA